MKKPAVFLDRDGTINIDYDHVHQIDKFDFIEGVIEACKALKEMGYLLVIVTNQSGIARGKFTEDQFLILTEWMDWSLADRGVELDGIYYCPHMPDFGCDCRKPKPGMLLDAQKKLDIDMSASYMLGDKLSDIQAGKAAGVGTNILVRTGQALTEEGEKTADFVLNSLSELPAFIRQRSQ